VVDLLRSDAVLSADLLRRATSAYYGLSAKVDGLQQCLVLLGLEEVRRVVLTLGTTRYAQQALKLPALRRCWRHSLATAIIADEAARVSGLNSDLGYTAGLLHDIGRIGLLAARPEPYAAMLARLETLDPTSDKKYLLSIERESFEVDHCAAGLWLTEQWNLPEELRAAAGRHHDTRDGDAFDLLALVHFSCAMADHVGFAILPNIVPHTYEELLARLPESSRKRFWPNSEELRAEIKTKLGEYDECIVDDPPAEPAATLEPRTPSQNLFSEPTPQPPPPEPAGEMGRSWGLWILIIGLALTLLFFYLEATK
jgi:putative nucleotidyltransferase with HDIG domain